MVKKLYTWRGRETTFECANGTYVGRVVVHYKKNDPRSYFYFKTTTEELLPISAHGRNAVKCINGGLVGVLRRSNGN